MSNINSSSAPLTKEQIDNNATARRAAIVEKERILNILKAEHREICNKNLKLKIEFGELELIVTSTSTFYQKLAVGMDELESIALKMRERLPESELAQQFRNTVMDNAGE